MNSVNLTLFKLRDKLKKDKSGMGSLVGVILGGVRCLLHNESKLTKKEHLINRCSS